MMILSALSGTSYRDHVCLGDKVQAKYFSMHMGVILPVVLG